jgi:hypothetical protein
MACGVAITRGSRTRPGLYAVARYAGSCLFAPLMSIESLARLALPGYFNRGACRDADRKLE